MCGTDRVVGTAESRMCKFVRELFAHTSRRIDVREENGAERNVCRTARE